MTISFSSEGIAEAAKGFVAAGTLDGGIRAGQPSEKRRLQLWAELGVVYIALPLLMRIAVFDYRVPLFYALPPVLVGFIAFLYFDRSFSLKKEISRWPDVPTLISILLIFSAGCLVVAGIVAAVMPDRLFALASERPGLWLKIMVLYPFTSVLPQEFAYRVFFFHRYGVLFGARWSLILANGLAFGFGHILFRNWIAVGGTFLIGMLLAWRYERTRSFWAVYVEHVLWGWLVFTIGLGVYFFTGVKNPAW
ncbi:CPBP family intramembrane glutamic endopeptidase [Hyphomicrobium sp.]|jgi:membrane protease YdiL (CAAX protease family)|uniref:CPBP family intramembrane glutamic endopeptidase n=1 Tax=Hyphomicrobium sp. TaxID=82 RepID=UPI003564B52B